MEEALKRKLERRRSGKRWRRVWEWVGVLSVKCVRRA
jgi:hypothetical protein